MEKEKKEQQPHSSYFAWNSGSAEEFTRRSPLQDFRGNAETTDQNKKSQNNTEIQIFSLQNIRKLRNVAKQYRTREPRREQEPLERLLTFSNFEVYGQKHKN